jgi:putative FmdB family regulatory protein
MNMPFYDLKCTKCGEEFNIMASMSQREQKLIKCPNCGNNELDPIFTNVNIIQPRKSESATCPNFEKCGGSCPHG